MPIARHRKGTHLHKFGPDPRVRTYTWALKDDSIWRVDEVTRHSQHDNSEVYVCPFCTDMWLHVISQDDEPANVTPKPAICKACGGGAIIRDSCTIHDPRHRDLKAVPDFILRREFLEMIRFYWG